MFFLVFSEKNDHPEIFSPSFIFCVIKVNAKLKKTYETNVTFLMATPNNISPQRKYKTSSQNNHVLILQEQFSVSNSIRIFDLFEVINSLSQNFMKL